jgi:hypothetical protein
MNNWSIISFQFTHVFLQSQVCKMHVHVPHTVPCCFLMIDNPYFHVLLLVCENNSNQLGEPPYTGSS